MNRKFKLIAPLAAGIALAAGIGAHADNSLDFSSYRISSSLIGEEKLFVMDTIDSSLAEIQMGRLAQKKAYNQAVREFGRRMELDHSKAMADFVNLAENKGLSVPQYTSGKYADMMHRLEGLSGEEFDRAYLSMMVEHHSKDVTDFRNYSQRAHSFELSSLVDQYLPTIERHSDMARDLSANPMGFYRPAGYNPMMAPGMSGTSLPADRLANPNNNSNTTSPNNTTSPTNPTGAPTDPPKDPGNPNNQGGQPQSQPATPTSDPNKP
jgi:putative membrane protein